MKLAQIQITGFKSFKNPTSIYFDKGLTGIVGPNGCGKSNIVDAILWVTGSAMANQLRGQQMEDIIFSGTDKYSSAGFSEVTLTLERDQSYWPDDFKSLTQIEITRKLRRGGDSQYFINGEACLLRNIHEFLSDTGSQSWSIVEQDTISTLISSKPDQIRDVIEQAAGTAQFKNKKRLAQNKLKNTLQNLLRINDILSEQKKHLKRLEKQAHQAQQYKEIKGKIRNIEIFLLKNLYNEINQKINDKKETFQSLHEKQNQSKKELTSCQNQYKTIRQNSEDIYSQFESQRNNLQTALNKLNECEINVQKLKTLIHSKTEASDHWMPNISDIQLFQKEKLKQINDLTDQIEKDKKQISEWELHFQNKKDESEKLQLQLQLFKKTLSENQSHLDKSLTEKTQKEESCKNLNKEQERIHQFLNQIQKDLENKKTKYQSLNDLHSQLIQKTKDKQNLHLGLKKKIDDLNENIQKTESLKKQNQDKLDGLRLSLIQKQEKQKNLLLLKEQFQSSKKDWLKIKKENNLTSLMEWINIETSFESAAKAFFDQLFHCFIIENLDKAAQIITKTDTQLSNNIFFLIVENLKENNPFKIQNIHHRLKNEKDFICFLKDKVQINTKNTNASCTLQKKELDCLLEHVVVINSINNIKNLSQKYPDLIFVTKKGEILKNKQSFGCVSLSSTNANPVVMENEIQDLVQGIQKTTDAINNMNSQISEQSIPLEKYKNELKGLEEKHDENDKIIYSQQKEIEIHEKTLSSMETEIESALKNIQEQESSIENILSLKNQHQSSLEELEKKIQKTKTTCSKTKENISQILNKTEKIRQTIEHIHISLIALKKDIKNKEHKIDFLNQSIDEISKREAEFSEKSNINQQSVQQNQLELGNLQKQLIKQKQDYENQNKIQIELEKNYQDKISLYKNLESKISNLNHSVDSISENKHKLELEIESFFVERKNLEEKTWENHQIKLINHDERENQLQDIKDEEKNESFLNQLKSDLSHIGQVNFLALNEYSTLKSEHEQLQKQYDDLDQSRMDLEQVIEEMEKISSLKFKKTFNELNIRLNQVFTSVFEGGKASLVLTQEKKEVPAGVEILACPPGKNLKNLKLLSGGEKSLTALSMVVALFLVHPAPFCILDEVDAALDDVNVARFNSLVREISKRCQVILITHNKYSMRECHRLYGVTMEEKGVTQLVSVNMKEHSSEVTL